MKKILSLLFSIVILVATLVSCGGSKPAMVDVTAKDSLVVGIIGENPALANVSIDMVVDFVQGLGKKADFNDINDEEVLTQLKEGKVDIAITFKCAEKDRKLAMCKIIKAESDSMCVLMRREDVAFRQNFEAFIDKYEKDGEMEKTVKKYVSSPKDVMSATLKPFKFD